MTIILLLLLLLPRGQLGARRVGAFLCFIESEVGGIQLDIPHRAFLGSKRPITGLAVLVYV